jgi:hypothetical protein
MAAGHTGFPVERIVAFLLTFHSIHGILRLFSGRSLLP